MADNTPYPVPRQSRQTDVLVGNGGTIYGPFNFKIFDTDDVEVWRKQADGSFAEVTVTVTKTSGEPFDTFRVTLPAPIGADTRFVVRSARIPERSAGVRSGTRIDMTAVEKEFSKIAAVEQELRRDLDRSLKSPFDQPGLTLGPLSDGGILMRQGDLIVDGPDGQAIIDAGENAERAEAAAQEVAGYDKAWTVFLDVTADGVNDTYLLADESGPKPVSTVDGQFFLNVSVGGAMQPSMPAADWPNIPYRIVEGGTKIQFSFVPKLGMRLYAKGAAGRASDPVDMVPWNKVYGTPTTLAGYGVTSVSWGTLVGTPTTLAGYGIDDVPWLEVSGKPTTFSGYGIDDDLALGTANADPASAGIAGTRATRDGFLSLHRAASNTMHIGRGNAGFAIVAFMATSAVGGLAVKTGGMRFMATTSVIWEAGAGSPEGAATAPVGSLWTRTDGGAGTTLYVKQSGTGNTGWAAK